MATLFVAVAIIVACAAITLMMMHGMNGKVTLQRRLSRMSSQSSTKPTCACVVRGYLYGTRTPISRSGGGVSYHQDIRNDWQSHARIVRLLSKAYDVNVYFVTYDDTVAPVLEWARNKGTVVTIENLPTSTQFWTVAQGLARIPHHDVLFVTRADITYFEAFDRALSRHLYPTKFYALNRASTHVARASTFKDSDLIAWLPHALRSKFERNLRHKKDLHDIHSHMEVSYLTDRAFSVRQQNAFYELPGKMHKTPTAPEE